MESSLNQTGLDRKLQDVEKELKILGGANPVIFNKVGTKLKKNKRVFVQFFLFFLETTGDKCPLSFYGCYSTAMQSRVYFIKTKEQN